MTNSSINFEFLVWLQEQSRSFLNGISGRKTYKYNIPAHLHESIKRLVLVYNKRARRRGEKLSHHDVVAASLALTLRLAQNDAAVLLDIEKLLLSGTGFTTLDALKLAARRSTVTYYIRKAREGLYDGVKVVTAKLPAHVSERLDMASIALGVSRSELVRAAVMMFLDYLEAEAASPRYVKLAV